MSLIDDVLISIDDQPQTRDSLEQIFTGTNIAYLFSAVGRLLSNGYISAVGQRENKFYKVTPKGDCEIKYNLLLTKRLLNNISIDCYLLSISNSEKYKAERDKIRSYLKKKGFVVINSGLLINGIVDLRIFRNELDRLVNHSNIIYFKLCDPPGGLTNHPKIPDLSLKYLSWIKSASKFSLNIPKDDRMKRLMSKILIYNLSLIIASSCTIKQPDRINEIKKVYNKIRNYCYI